MRIGCGTSPHDVRTSDENYVYARATEFDELFSTSSEGVGASFKALEYPLLAVCTKYSSGRRHVTVDPDAWENLSPTGKEVLMFHELGHCVLNRGHDDTQIDTEQGKIPNSIMFYQILKDWEYELYRRTRSNIMITINQDLGLDYQDWGQWRSYELIAGGDSYEELLESASIVEINQEGKELACYGLNRAEPDVYREAVFLIQSRVEALYHV